jgi:hypothetical protein
VRASLNTWLLGNGLVISVDCEHETRMEDIAPASATHPVNQVGNAVVYYNVAKKC